jgi:organic radical activating enzyme
MFGQNKIENQNLGDGRTLRIVKGSPWLTVQGEGPFTGHRAVFIRLHGCPLRCHFCDTNFDNPEDPVVHLADLIDQVGNFDAELCVITGGEPTNQNIVPLCRELMLLDFQVQIETAGIAWVENLNHHSQIVCSPKTPRVHPKIAQHAVAFKYVISTSMEFDTFIPITATQPGTTPRKLAPPPMGTPVYLSPMDEYDEVKNRANRKLVGELAIKYGCIAGLQLHKFLELD